MTIQSSAFLSGVRRLAPDQFVEGILSGNRRVLSRFITLLESRLVEDRRLAQHVLTALLPHTGRSIRVGITGVPGSRQEHADRVTWPDAGRPGTSRCRTGDRPH